MKDFDKLRHGNITKDQMRLALNMAQLPLSEVQFKSIVEGFPCEGKANYVNWKDFCDAVDEVFGVKQLEKISPHLKVDTAKTSLQYGRKGITA